jgi:hypothetical protein
VFFKGAGFEFGGLPVGFATMFHGEDHDGIAEIMKTDAVVADAEAELGRLDALEAAGGAENA